MVSLLGTIERFLFESVTIERDNLTIFRSIFKSRKRFKRFQHLTFIWKTFIMQLL